MFSLLCSDSDMDCHSKTYDVLLERCGSTESSNTNSSFNTHVTKHIWCPKWGKHETILIQSTVSVLFHLSRVEKYQQIHLVKKSLNGMKCPKPKKNNMKLLKYL